jgi:mannose-6-phosphate isomerase-like protein (cupin superfamily)
MPAPFRRIVTTNDSDGRSEILFDEPARNALGVLTEMWRTGDARHDHTDRLDHASDSKSLEPPRGGTVFRFFQLPPISAFTGMSDEQREQLIAQMFASWNATHTRRSGANGTMHQTRTTDYIILLSGEVTLVLDKEERDLKPFDVVIQRGTSHAWVNKGSGEALLMGVLVDDNSSIEKQ